MKLLKKFMSLLFVIALAFSMLTNVTVANAETGSSTATITVNGIVQDGSGDVIVTAYQIIELDSSTSTGYKYVSWLQNAIDAGEISIGKIESPTKDELTKIITYIKNNKDDTSKGISGIDLKKDSVDESKYTYTFDGSNAPENVGMYVIVVTNTSTDYTSMAASIGVTKETDGSLTYDLTNATIDVTQKSSNITIDKTTTDADRDLAIGDTVDFTITTEIPSYTNTDQTFVNSIVYTITDTLSEGLDLDTSSIVIKIGDVDTPDLQIDNSSTGTYAYNTIVDTTNAALATFKVDLSSIAKTITTGTPDKYTYAGKTVTITYSATLNSNAETGFDPNTNKATVTYTNTLGEEKTYSDTTYHYTFEIDGYIWSDKNGSEIEKVGKEGTNGTTTALEGAEFKLYSDEDCTQSVNFYTCKVLDTTSFDSSTSMKGYYLKENGAYIKITDEATTFDSSKAYYTLESCSSTVSTSAGMIHIAGLDVGTYYLQESTAPEGYTLNSTPVKIVISAKYSDTTGRLESYTISIGDSEATKYTATYTADDSGTITDVSKSTTATYFFQNTTVASLPSTGGIGTMVFTVVGCGLMIAAAAAFLVSRRRREEKE